MVRNPFLFLLVLLCGVLNLEVEGSSTHRCHPVELGSSFTLSWRGLLAQHSAIEWLVRSKEGSEIVRLICPSDKADCENPRPDKYKVTAHNPHSGSRLTITNVSKEDHGHNVECRAISQDSTRPSIRDTNQHQPLTSCEVHVYKKPQNLQCSFKKINPSTVHVRCLAEQVFPGILCKVYRIDDSSHNVTLIQGSKVVYSQVDQNGNVVENSEGSRSRRHAKMEQLKSCCDLDDVIPFNGSYSYVTVAYPVGGDRTKALGRKTSASSKVSDSMSINDNIAHVKMKKHGIRNVCPGSTVTLWCEAFGFPSEPQFSWNLPPGIKETVVHKGGLYENKYTFQPSKLLDGQLATCSAQYMYGSESKVVADSGVLSLFWPPEDQPVFGDQKGAGYNIVTYSKNGAADLTCVVHGGKPEVRNITVKCDQEQHGQVVEVLKLTRTGNRIDFTVTGNENTTTIITCKCFAHHVTGCYDKVSTIEIHEGREELYSIGIGNQDNRSMIWDSPPTDGNNSTTMTIIMCVVCGSIILLTPALIFMGWKLCVQSKNLRRKQQPQSPPLLTGHGHNINLKSTAHRPLPDLPSTKKEPDCFVPLPVLVDSQGYLVPDSILAPKDQHRAVCTDSQYWILVD